MTSTSFAPCCCVAMPEHAAFASAPTGPEPLEALVPAAIAVALTALALLMLVWLIRRSRRGPRARAAAEAQRSRAGAALVEVDDAAADLDVEIAVSGALNGGDAPPSLRRARLSTSHSRDDLFAAYRDISVEGVHPVVITRTAARIRERASKDLATITRARSDHREWTRTHVDNAAQVTSASARLDALRDSMGDEAALVRDLSTRFDAVEWEGASRAARDAVSAADEAASHLNRARSLGADASQSVRDELAVGERALRRAQSEARALEESHRLITQAAIAVPNELTVARAAIAQARIVRQRLSGDEAERLEAAISGADASLAHASTLADRRPTAAIAELAQVHSRLDLALGSARTAQQRLRGARTALPGTIAAARAAVAQAEVDVARDGTGADARVRLALAQQQLAGARQADDPVVALDAARRAIRHADDARALSNDHARA